MAGLLAELSTPVQSHITTGFRGGQRELRCHSSGVPDGDPLRDAGIGRRVRLVLCR